MKKLLIFFLFLSLISFAVIGLTACDSSCDHQWGEWYTITEPTCTTDGLKEQKCTLCGTAASEALTKSHTPSADDGDCTTAITCSVCSEITTAAKEAHTGGTPTCKNKASCSLCGKEYGALESHIPAPDDGDCTTAITCSVCGEATTAANTSHTGGTPTCKHKAECAVCGKEYGKPAEHIPGADDGDCTTAVICSVCGDIAIAANETHTGGTPTCKNKASCSLCGKEYGELESHVSGADDKDCTTAILCTVCKATVVAAQAHNFNGAWQKDAHEHWHTCGNENCLMSDTKAAHIPNIPEATTKQDKKCTVCNYIIEPMKEEVTVWIPTKGGKKYHSRPSCSNMIDPEQVTLDDAKAQGFTACKRCY